MVQQFHPAHQKHRKDNFVGQMNPIIFTPVCLVGKEGRGVPIQIEFLGLKEHLLKKKSFLLYYDTISIYKMFKSDRDFIFIWKKWVSVGNGMLHYLWRFHIGFVR